MRQFECGSMVPGCALHTRADEDAEIVRRAVEHLKSAHGESVIRESTVDHIKERITDASEATPTA